MNSHIANSIKCASKFIGTTWPLHTFVTSNPLSGYENRAFHDAVQLAKHHFNAKAYPEANLYKKALDTGDINTNILSELLKDNGFLNPPASYLSKMTGRGSSDTLNKNHTVDRLMTKWLSVFMDEGLSEWNMPFRELGFYRAWKQLAIYDNELNQGTLRSFPKTSEAVIEIILKDFPPEEYSSIFISHLAALPGWTGYINHREQTQTSWQTKYPITLLDYIAVRLLICQNLNHPIRYVNKNSKPDNVSTTLQNIYLQAWEKTFQTNLNNTLKTQVSKNQPKDNHKPDAQLVFCIDTRSEQIRRHVEATGNYETYGYAGFFGITMDYKNPLSGIIRKSCPPIVESAYIVSETAQEYKEEQFSTYQKKNKTRKFQTYFLKRMKNMLPSAFGYVEGSGVFYGISILARTLLPGRLYRWALKNETSVEDLTKPHMRANTEADIIPLPEKVAIVKSAFDLMGWKQFAPLVIFVGHGSHSANNPFSSSLDCGACAASPGRHNARLFAQLANRYDVRKILAEEHHINIPTTTQFVGAEHNTTTDNITLFDSEVPQTHHERLHHLKRNLHNAKRTLTHSKLGTNEKSIAKAEHKAHDWSDTRPEWGLAKNASFIIGPRTLTKNTNLDGRSFLHSYDWKADIQGNALEGIMQGPMVVTQWINNHYYFATVDNKTYGGGTKVTHNITGKFGVIQGNGGDLKKGLPLQSLYETDDIIYHQPLRLSVIIQAPLHRVSEILIKNTNIRTLLDNEWIYLTVMDPTHKNDLFLYKKSIQWTPVNETSKQKPTVMNHELELMEV